MWSPWSVLQIKDKTQDSEMTAYTSKHSFVTSLLGFTKKMYMTFCNKLSWFESKILQDSLVCHDHS